MGEGRARTAWELIVVRELPGGWGGCLMTSQEVEYQEKLYCVHGLHFTTVSVTSDIFYNIWAKREWSTFTKKLFGHSFHFTSINIKLWKQGGTGGGTV